MVDAMFERFREVLMSIYLYNEHRGYTQLEALEAALRARRPHERALADAVAKHARDERKHYQMFRAWFRKRGRMPFHVDARAGYIDRLVRAVGREPLDQLDFGATVTDAASLRQLCHLIALTERRGLAQVRWLLGFEPVARDASLHALFTVVERDEPSHFEPYRAWLAEHGVGDPSFREHMADVATHLSIVCTQLPKLLLDPRLPRLTAFPA